MTLPSISLNGTKKENLVEALCEAKNAMDTAIEKMSETCPNARDYALYLPARTEHSARMKKAFELRDELYQLAMAISEIGE